MCAQADNFVAELGQSLQLVRGLQGVDGAAVAKRLSALRRQSNPSGALRAG